VLSSVAVTLAAVEAGFRINDRHTPKEHTIGSFSEPGYFTADHELGYGPVPNVRRTARKMFGSQVIFDATYTIDSSGSRITVGNPDGPAWVFMGCSFTFGEGVNDDETLPWQVSVGLHDSAHVVNLGFHGYGAHQMLRQLETNRLHGVTRPVKHVIYQAINEHVRRSAGRAWWDLQGPSYRISGDTVVYGGPFRSQRHVKFLGAILRSKTVSYFANRFYFNSGFSDRDLDLYTRIVERSARIAKTNLGADFTILYWDDDTPEAKRALAGLRKTGLPIILVSSIIPRAEWKGLLYPHDRHPRPRANVRLARGIVSLLDH
jgi:hypothetical protein